MKFLTMNIYVNAWLDCSNPFISIHNKFDNNVLLHLNAEKVKKLMESGDICTDDFQTTDSDQLLQLISNLFTFESGERIYDQLKDLQSGLVVRSSNQVPEISKHSDNTRNEIPSTALLYVATH